MAGIVFGVVTFDPVTGSTQAVQADLDWNLGTAVVVADALGGSVVAAERLAWTLVADDLIEQARAATHAMQIDDELRSMLAGGEGSES